MRIFYIICSLVCITCSVLILIFWNNSSNNLSNSSGGIDSEISGYQIANHNTVGDCWTTYGGVVYDFSGYFSDFPNATLATQLCGRIEPTAKLPTNLQSDSLTSYQIGILAP